MIPWVELDTDDSAGLRLMQRGQEFSIRVGVAELMNSRMHGSEEALAQLACTRISGRAPHILIGGLGMGFTLRAALDAVGPEARITVAELSPGVIRWNQGPLAALSRAASTDARVTVHEEDVAELIRAARAAYDAILLDVDNGPDGMVQESNDWLYGPAGLAAAKSALRPGGVLAVWSAAPDREFGQRLRQVGYQVDEQRVRARGASGGARHVIWVAAKAGSAGQARG